MNNVDTASTDCCVLFICRQWAAMDDSKPEEPPNPGVPEGTTGTPTELSNQEAEKSEPAELSNQEAEKSEPAELSNQKVE